MPRNFPEPIVWTHSAFVEFVWGEQQFRLICYAGDVREQIYDGRIVTWLVLMGTSMLPKPIKMGTDAKVVVVQVPASYITKMEDGPVYRIKEAPKEYKVGLFLPIHPDPTVALGLDEVRRRVGELLTPARN